jgi:hypothetical protein
MDAKLRTEKVSQAPVAAQAPTPSSKAAAAKIDISKQLAKTKMCMHYLKGKCRYGVECSYAHNEIELRHRPNLRKTRLCKNFEMGACDNPHCAYAHGSEELRGTDGVWKTVMCAKWLNGTCRAGSRCRFAHGQHELQDPPKDEEEDEFGAALAELNREARDRANTVDYRDARDSEGNPLLPGFFNAGLPISPGLSPMNFSLPFGVTPEMNNQEPLASTPTFEPNGHTAAENMEVVRNIAKTLKMIHISESYDPFGMSTTPPKDPAPPPPPVPTKWQKLDTKKHLKGTPERKGRPNRPLSPLSPTTLNCLPSALFSPGSLSPPPLIAGNGSW